MIKPKFRRMLILKNFTFLVLSAVVLFVTYPVNFAINNVSLADTVSSTPVIQANPDPVKKVDPEEAKNAEKAKRLDKYFAGHKMPLAGHGKEFIQAANKYGIDWRLLPAIGVIESTGGKFMINNNPFGWGSARIRFSSVSEAIDNVSKHLGGYNPSTAKYYKTPNTRKKLRAYNKSDVYVSKVTGVMELF